MSESIPRIAILGVGLIGGSLAKCWKAQQAYRLIGYSPNPASIHKYLQLGVVDEAYTELSEAVAQADFIFVCAPVGKIPDYLAELSRMPLKPGCVVTDVGSTKSRIMIRAAELNWGEAVFIGGHPMAGSERSGVEAANEGLFENAIYVVTPPEQCPPSQLDALYELLSHTRAQIVTLDAETHDRVVGAISHLPHLIAVALVNQVAGYDQDERALYRTLAAGGFRDLTRIASSDPIVWRDILLQNQPVMLDLMNDWIGQMEIWREDIRHADGGAIQSSFDSSNRYRKKVPERKRGLLYSLHECYVDLPDRPGAIGQLATLLGQKEINLRNLHVNEQRADVPGVLRLSFKTALDLERAILVMQTENYVVHEC
jgi:prephenate dehydrogenase